MDVHKTIEIECTHMVVCRGPDKQQHQVIFDPTPETVKAVFKWKEDGDSRYISCDDRTGLHTSRTHEAVANIVLYYGTMIVTTV